MLASRLPQDASLGLKNRKEKYASRPPPLAESSLSSSSNNSLHDLDDPSTSQSWDDSCSSTADRQSLKRAVSGMLCPKRRFGTASSLPWGHRPHPAVGASCFLFAVPVPLLASCYPVAAALFSLVTVTSYLSDHVYTGLDSYAHLLDRVTAPITFLSALLAVYDGCGPLWASSSLAAVTCHVLANSAAKRGEYERFVIFHTLWHAVGVFLVSLACWCNGTHLRCIGDTTEDTIMGALK